MPDGPIILHASAVCYNGAGALILGASGAGKSSFALDLMAFGCDLVSDDRTILTRKGSGVWLSVPGTISGLIEARGVGILRAVPVASAKLVCVIDLDETECERLPENRTREILGTPITTFHKSIFPSFTSATLQYLKSQVI